jgi:hypothetical protein
MPAKQPYKANATVVRSAFAIEAAANLFGAFMMFTYPSEILHLCSPSSTLIPALSHPATSSPSPQARTLLTWLGAMVVGLTPQLILALPETPRAIASREMVYVTLLAGEAVLVAVMGWQGLVKGENETGVSGKALAICIANLAPLMAWRVYILGWKRSWFGESGVEVKIPKAEGKDN